MHSAQMSVEIFRDNASDIEYVIKDLPQDAIAWQPHPESNSIGVTVWHVSRWIDVLNVRALLDKPAEDELWHVSGWRERTGYDPRGIGRGGLGVITGYTTEEMQAVPAMSAADLLTYLNEVTSALVGTLESLSEDEYHATAPGAETLEQPGATRYQWVKSILMGEIAHRGEIAALKALYNRMQA